MCLWFVRARVGTDESRSCGQAPTIFSPMLLNSTPDERIDGMMGMMADPSTFCVASEADAQPAFLWRMQASQSGYLRPGQSVTCASAACLQATVLGVADFASLEALVDPAQSTTASVALHRYQTGEAGDWCLAVEPPGPGYKLVNASAPPEGWCAPQATGEYTQPLVLWYSAKLDDHRTCGGGKGCHGAAGYARKQTLCYARPAADPKQLPCRFGLPSIGRSDSAFWDQVYWRGRIWAPQIYLVYAGLKRHEHVPSAAAKKAQLAEQAERLFRQQLGLFGQVNENTNGILGVGSDSTRADSYYHWGALHALVAIAQTGAYPSPML